MKTNSHIIAFATDTVYGLGVRCNDRFGLDELYQLKRRPNDQAMQALVANRGMAQTVVNLRPTDIIDAQTRIYPARNGVDIDPRLILQGGIGVRQPNQPALLEYIQNIGVPLAATSANLRGEPALCSAGDVEKVFPNISIVVIGDCVGGQASEVWDMRCNPPVRLR